MRERLGVWLVLAGAFLLARVVTALAVSGRPPRGPALALHLAAIPLAQAAALSLGGRRREPEQP